VRLGYRRSTNDALTPETPGGTVAPPHRQSPGEIALIQEAFMALITSLLASLRQDEEGQGLAEYALILALIAIVAIVALIFLGGQVSSILSNVGNSV
jgi:pilus assembly protein Flp/PilA